MTADSRRVAAFLALLVSYGATAAGVAAEPAAGTSGTRYYTLADFQRVEKIDAHVHVHGRADRFMAQAIADGFRILTINVDSPDHQPIREQELAAPGVLERETARYLDATKRGDAENTGVLVGEAVALIREVQPAGTILRQIVREADAMLGQKAPSVLTAQV